MSRRKRRQARLNGPIFGVQTPERKTDRVPPPADAERQELQAAVREGVKTIEAKVDACIDQVRADAQAIETTARLLSSARDSMPPSLANLMFDVLMAMAAGMRLAANRMPDSREIPF